MSCGRYITHRYPVDGGACLDCGQEPSMTTDKQAVERAAKTLFAVTADQIGRDPNGYEQLSEHSKEQVREAALAVLEAASLTQPKADVVGRVARAICNAAEADDFDTLPSNSVYHALYLQQARAAIAAMSRGEG